MGTEFQFYQEKVLELGYIHNNENILDTLNCTLTIVNGTFYCLLPQTSCLQPNTDRHCAQAQWDGAMQPSTQDLSRGHGPFSEIALPTGEHGFRAFTGR